MFKDNKILDTSIELKQACSENGSAYYSLSIGSDPESRVIISEDNLDNLLNALPSFLNTVIQSQVTVETNSAKGE